MQIMPLVSIIIPINKINDYLREAIPHHLKQSFQDFEIIVFVDEPEPESWEKTRVIPVGSVRISPPEKRDLALKHAQGEYLAFIDDDAYPDENWLANALPLFENPDVAAVCGPGVTPDSDSLSQKTGGWVSASPMGGWNCADRFIPGKRHDVDDWASVNLIVRKSDFEAVGGYGVTFWPGEDTKLCLDLTKKLGKKIIYDPEVVVYHHRRALFRPHLIQNGRYGLHRGHFARVYPQTSCRVGYFIPSLFVVYLFGLIVSVVWCGTTPIVWLPLIVYIFCLGLNSLWIYLKCLGVPKSKRLAIALFAIPGVFVTHIWYGIRFIQGLVTGKIRKNRSDA